MKNSILVLSSCLYTFHIGPITIYLFPTERRIPMIGLGIDTGGTCTDAVIYDLAQNTVLASAKTPTTKEDLKTGIRNVLDRLPQDLLNSCQTLALSTTLAQMHVSKGNGEWETDPDRTRPEYVRVFLAQVRHSRIRRYLPAGVQTHALSGQLCGTGLGCISKRHERICKRLRLRQHRSAFRKRIPRAA